MIIFNASLPRAGSTLLSNILGNNPDIYASPTSSLADVVYEAHSTWTSSNLTMTEGISASGGYYTDKRQDAIKGFLRNGIEGYYNEITDKNVIVDKNRNWMSDPFFMKEILPESKIICLVRHPFDIFGSMEKIWRSTPMISKSAHKVGHTVEERVHTWLTNKPIIPCIQYIYNVIQTQPDNVVFYRYEDLVESPDEVMKEIYKYTGLPYYKHDFNNIQQVTVENDIESIYGSHTIRSKVEPPIQLNRNYLTLGACKMIETQFGKFMEYMNYQKLEVE